MLVLEQSNAVLFAQIQQRNLIRQYDLLTDSIVVGLAQGPQAFDKYLLWALNHVAVAHIAQLGGRFREEPIYVGDHLPPHHESVPSLMDRFTCFVHENWHGLSATQMAAYGLWRLNWIHPFIEGNGRTARAACYYLLRVKTGRMLPGRKIVPERIREARDEYVAALREADLAWADGHVDISRLDAYLARLLTAQLRDDD